MVLVMLLKTGSKEGAKMLKDKAPRHIFQIDGVGRVSFVLFFPVISISIAAVFCWFRASMFSLTLFLPGHFTPARF
jgi:hypothetical protein